MTNEETREAMIAGVVEKLRVEGWEELNNKQLEDQMERNTFSEQQERKFELWQQQVEVDRRVQAEGIVDTALNGSV